jgi:hypothetical protein
VAVVKRDIYCDLTNQVFVVSDKTYQPVKVAPVFHQQNLRLHVYLLEIDPTRAANVGPFVDVDPTGVSLAVKVFTSTGTVLASQTSFTVVDGALVGNLNLNTAEMATAFASSSTTLISNAVIEFEITDADGSITIQRTDFEIKREYITSGSPVATPPDEYYTKAEIDAVFVRFSGNPAGYGIELLSPDGTKTNTLQTLDSGAFNAEPS